LLERTLEIGMVKRGAKLRNRFPHRVVEKQGACADRLMQLSGDVSRLLFHSVRVVLPRIEQSGDISLRYLKHIHKDDRRCLCRQLLKDRKILVKRPNLKH
jgi:hypothetical protein